MKSGCLAAIVALLVSSLALTIPATASNTVDFSNSGGERSVTNRGLSLSRSTLIGITGWNGGSMITGGLGSVSFNASALMGGLFKKAGASTGRDAFASNGNGTNRVPNGVLLSDRFSGPVTWTLTTLADGTLTYTLTGVVTGMMGGTCVHAVSVQLTTNTGRGYFSGSSLVSGENTSVSSVPEPSTIALFVTGSVMLGMIRRELPRAISTKTPCCRKVRTVETASEQVVAISLS